MHLGIFLEQIPDGDGPWWQSLASGLEWTLVVAAAAWIVAFAIGSVVGIARTTDRAWLVRLGGAYVELFRNIPLIVQFFVWFFVVPGVIPAVKRWVVSVDPLTYQLITAVACLGLFTAARLAEQVRAGIQSLSRGQRDAARALGLSQVQTYRHVLLPMAYRIIIPPLTSELMNLIKNTAVAYSIGLTELFFRTREMGEMTFRYFEAFAAATAIYVVIAFASNRAMALLERKVAVPGYIGAGQ
ncbi:MAG TPA: amino acid ABC transporter permease [Burkholderiales bacterium]|nr:amino acid ABC transporter permease [Burkholderiales bacterium]